MSIIGFGKKIEEDVDVAEESISGRKVDVNGNLRSNVKRVVKSKKKEPPKPWGKRERLVVFWVLAVTVITSALLALSAREWKLPGFPRLSIPEIKLFETETIIIEGDKEDSKMFELGQKITEEFKSSAGGLSGVYGFYVIDLETGYSFGLFENEVFDAASLIKLPVMVGMYIKEEKGSINLNDKYVLKNEDKLGGSGSLYSKPAGYETTYRNLVSLMGKQSDNTAFNVGKKYLGEEGFIEVTKKVGMENTSLADNKTTPKDIGVFFEELWKENVVNDKNKEEILDSLTDTIYEQWLSAGVDDGIRVAHKYGRELHVVNDAGIIYAKKPYVAVIMTKGVIEREADDTFPTLSRIIFEGMTERK